MIAKTFDVYTMKGSSVMARMAGIESTAIVVLRYRHHPTKEFQYRVALGVDLLILLQGHFDASQDQKSTHDVDNPVEFLNQRDPGKDEQGAHQQGADDSPK